MNFVSQIKLLIEKQPKIAKLLRFIYRNTFLKMQYKKQNALLFKNGKEALELLDDVFRELSIPYWLAFGTLLGAIRDKAFISHDVDIDLGLFLSDHSNNIEKKLIEKGFSKKHKISIDDNKYGLEESYWYKGINLDLFFFTKKDNQIYTHGFINEQGLSWEKTLEKHGGYLVREVYFPWEGKIGKTFFLGREYPIPPCSEKHLSVHYGTDYMQKNPNWNHLTAKNVINLTNKIGVVTSYE